MTVQGANAGGQGLRVGLFGRLGSGNIGNDVSAEVVLDYLRREHPDATLDAMCTGPERIRARWGIPATRLFWQPGYLRWLPSPVRLAHLLLDKSVDAVRVASWTRRQDVVIVAGMGAQEATLPIRPWETPYAMFLLSTCGRLFGTKVLMVSIGASPVRQRATRWLLNASARLAHYRSYRDEYSRNAMTGRGLRAEADPVYPDLTFGIPLPSYDEGDPDLVGIGVMDYSGGNDDRGQATRIRADYIGGLKQFACWLVGSGKRIRLFVGDRDDEPVASEILAFLREQFPGLAPGAMTAEPVTTFDELSRAMQGTGFVVGTRFHNVVCAVRLAKPAIALSYADKSVAVMTKAGLAGYCLPARDLAAPALIELFQKLEAASGSPYEGSGESNGTGADGSLRERIRKHTAAQQQELDEQFALLSRNFLRKAP